MRFFLAAVSAAIAAALLAGCTGNSTGSNPTLPNPVAGAQGYGAGLDGFQGFPVSLVPKNLRAHHHALFGKVAPLAARRGIYVSAFDATNLWGFPKNNPGNGPATCTVSPTTSNNNIGVDNAGYLMVPNARDGISVYSNASMCGTLLGTITDSYGPASDASAVDAVNGKIAVANAFDGGGNEAGSISICSLSSGTCTANLTNPNIYEMAGVAMNSHGDCWGDAVNASFAAVLVWFQGCTGSGVLTTGFTNSAYGGVDIDNKGNLVTTSLFGPDSSLPSQVVVYSGCNPACTMRSSTTLSGQNIFGHVGRANNRFVTADLETGGIEVYSYKPSGLSLLYSFTGGLDCVTDQCEGAAYSPSSRK